MSDQRQEYSDDDMADVGRAFMEAIEQARTGDPFMKGWAPLQCPSELVFDLLNRMDEQRKEAADEIASLRAQLAIARSDLIGIAADCHRVKWQFDLSEDYKPTAAAARLLITRGFDELHRIGDRAIKAKDALTDEEGKS
jgi:hypothetical protein